MVDAHLYGAFLIAAFALCIAPGPDMMFIVAMGGRGGPLTGVLAATGVALGMLVHMVAAALGLSALFENLPVLYHVLRWAGAAYLLWLAWKAFRDRGEVTEDAGVAAAGPRRRRAFWQGMVTNLLNPKVIMFNIAFLPQFVDAGRGHVGGQLMILGVSIVVMGWISDSCIGLAAGRLSQLIRRSRRFNRGLNIFSGTVFAGLAVRLAASSPK
ncbi:LysE family translocator [Streptomyces boninensis]|uniref:LysE family translocator n=1 Tax=Streptomyces boninensis TaxID=2039455 RepID=UPI003B21F006